MKKLDGYKTKIIGYLIALKAILNAIVPFIVGEADLGATITALYANADLILNGFGLVTLRAGIAKIGAQKIKG